MASTGVQPGRGTDRGTIDSGATDRNGNPILIHEPRRDY